MANRTEDVTLAAGETKDFSGSTHFTLGTVRATPTSTLVFPGGTDSTIAALEGGGTIIVVGANGANGRSGANGAPGQAGESGSNGANGVDAADATFHIDVISGDWTIAVSGGAGGVGGNGGNGGEGGGNGGNGGNGGDGGSGSRVVVLYGRMTPDAHIIARTPAAPGGLGGAPGMGGRPNGQPGFAGAAGRPGHPGQITIQQQER